MKLIRKDVINLALPVFTEQFFVMLMGVINTVMVSNIGKEAVSAVGMVDSINNIFIAFFSSLAVGSTVVIAHYVGRRQVSEANEAAKQGLVSGVALSVLITIAICVFRSQIIGLLFGAAEESVIGNTHTYLNITLFTYPLIAATSISCGVLRGAGDTRTPMKVTIFMNVVNILLSYILIYGININNGHFVFSLPGLGVKGAALGIAFARAIGAVLILLTLFRGSKILKLTGIHKFRFNMLMQKSIFGVGIPASVESLMFNIGKLITQVFVVGMGTASIAAYSIAFSVFGMINIPGSSLSITAITLVGQHMGKGETKESESAMKYVILLATVCELPVCMISLVLANIIASLYSQNTEVVTISAQLIRAASIAIPILWPLSFILPSGLRGAGDAKFTMVIAIASMWIFRVSFGYLLGVPLGLGVMGVWLGMFTDWIFRDVIFYIRLIGGKWKNKVVIRDTSGVEAG